MQDTYETSSYNQSTQFHSSTGISGSNGLDGTVSAQIALTASVDETKKIGHFDQEKCPPASLYASLYRQEVL